MLEIQQNLETPFDDLVGLTAQYVDDKPDTAGIVFVPGVIESLTAWRSYERR